MCANRKLEITAKNIWEKVVFSLFKTTDEPHEYSPLIRPDAGVYRPPTRPDPGDFRPPTFF